jgi:F-type H+-transporting ATPase subunit b|tara:strand:+ start:212 stop:709 length:498 start_codon:yes stop_codon:yes gene_type:complete
MIIDATFWVAISFFIFIGVLLYFKVPQKIIDSLDHNIGNIKKDVDTAEKLKEEAQNMLSEQEKNISNSKLEIKIMIEKANEESEKNVLNTNKSFHEQMENRKKSFQERIKQMKDQAFQDVKHMSVKIAIESVENLLKNSVDKGKLDKIFLSSVEETKLALKKKFS